MNKKFARIRTAARKAAQYVDNKALAVGVALAAPLLAHAQATDPFDAAVTNAKTKIGEYGAELVGVAAVGVIFMIGIKYIKKIRGAA